RIVAAGVNWSPALRIPFAGLSEALGEARVDNYDEVVFAIHLAYPGANATDRGKSRYELPREITEAMRDAVRAVCADWRKVKAKDGREGERADGAAVEEARRRGTDQKRTEKQIVKDAAWSVMAEAYKLACGSQRLAHARQVMYSARPLVLKITGGKIWKNSK